MGYIRAQLEEGADAVRQTLYMAVFMTVPFPSGRMSGDGTLPPMSSKLRKKKKSYTKPCERGKKNLGLSVHIS